MTPHRLSIAIVAVIAVFPMVAAATPADEAAQWIDTLIRGGKKQLPAGSTIAIVFDSGKQFAPDTPCGKLRFNAKAGPADVAAFATCVQTAAKQFALDGTPALPGKLLREDGERYLKAWFHASLHPRLAVPTGHRALGTTVHRQTGKEIGVSVMIYVVFDRTGHLTAIYVRAGDWEYPVKELPAVRSSS